MQTVTTNPGARVLLVGHSLGGNAVRKSSFANMCSRITIDPWGEEFLPLLDQRAIARPSPTLAGRFVNVLAEVPDDQFGLRGYRIRGADPEVIRLGTDHFDVVPAAESARDVADEVRRCLGGASPLVAPTWENTVTGARLAGLRGLSFLPTFGPPVRD